MSTHVADSEYFPGSIQRVDSDRTDESPFGSTLTTPVDEDVELFPGIAQRLLSKNAGGDLASVYLGSQEGRVGGYELLAAIQDATKLSTGATIKIAPTPSPSLDRVDIGAKVEPAKNLNARVSRPRAGSIYSQPNLPLPIPGETPGVEPAEYPLPALHVTAPELPLPASANETEIPGPITSKPLEHPTDQAAAEDATRTAQEFLCLLPFAPASAPDVTTVNAQPGSSLSSLSLSAVLPTVLRVILFLPWCVLGGAAMLLFPAHLETVFYSTGYTSTPRGIHRFAFWADVVPELVSIFVATLLVLWYTHPQLGVVAIGGVTALTVYAWHGFKVDRRVPLGEDDQQSVYLVWKQYRFADALLGMKRMEEGFFVSGTGSDEVSETREKVL